MSLRVILITMALGIGTVPAHWQYTTMLPGVLKWSGGGQNPVTDVAKVRDQIQVEHLQPQSSKEKAARQAKNARYNGGACDLTSLLSDQLCVEQVWPRGLPLVPLEESDQAVLGDVTTLQCFMAADRTRIYTEMTVRVEETFKVRSGSDLARGKTLIIDQEGGIIRLPSGRPVRDQVKVEFLGRTYAGGRYVLFAKRIHNGKDLSLVRAYELRDGRVFRLRADGGPGNILLLKSMGNASAPYGESEFLQLVRDGGRVVDP